MELVGERNPGPSLGEDVGERVRAVMTGGDGELAAFVGSAEASGPDVLREEDPAPGAG